MKRRCLLLVLVVCAVDVIGTARANDQADAKERLGRAIRKSIALIESSSAEYIEQRTCFSCHHQALPILTLTEARRRGFAINEENLSVQLKRTVDHLQGGKDNYLQGKGQGGQADTAGYALWALAAGRWPADDTTSAVAEYLLRRDADRDYWHCSSNRPPSEAGDFTTTSLALRGLAAFGAAEQHERVAARREAARAWLAKTKTKDTEDRVFRLHALRIIEAPDEEIQAAVEQLVATRHDDGSWSQTDQLASDAYATASALVALQQSGGMSTTDPIYQYGIDYLLASQLDDGSWKVASRSKPFQTYFESGFPHGPDQFISMAASCWATQALLFVFPAADELPARGETDAAESATP